MVRLLQSWYSESHPQRAEELNTCLANNLALECVDEVCLLLERGAMPALTHPKLRLRATRSRPTYRDFFLWANEMCSSSHDVTVVANSDLYFDQTLTLLEEMLQPEQCAAISRWDVISNGTAVLFDRNDSQDAWCFRGQIRPIVCDFCVGIPRCDNRILFELRQAGYQVINPAFSVRAFHLHAGQRNEYPGQIQGPHVPPPYAYLYPHNLLTLPQMLLYNLKHPHCRIGWRPDWRLLQRWSPLSLTRRLAKRVLRRAQLLVPR